MWTNCLCENPKKPVKRYQLSRSSKPRRGGTECVLGASLHFAWPSPSPFLAPAEQLRGNEVQASPKEKSGTCMQHFGLLWGCLRDWLLSHLTKSANKNGSILCMAAESKGKLHGWLQHQRYCSTKERHQGEKKITSS